MKAFDDFLLWQAVVYYVVATALGCSHYYIVAVIIIVLLTSILVHGRTDGQSRHIRLLVCTDARSLKTNMCLSVCLSVCLSFMHYYTIHPISMKVNEVVQYTPAKVSGIKKKIFF